MVATITEKTANDIPINREEALYLLTEADLLAVGKLADAIRRSKHPHGRVTFVVF